MIQLTGNESRILGVLIEKATTTPDQYPLSLNAAVNGANQKNNRDPVLSLGEDEVFEALETLRGKGLVVRVDVPGNRVHKYRHIAGDALRARPGELAIIAELMLRGPQTLGELRGRASRMAPLESLEVVKGLLDALMTREESLVTELPPSPGSRAERYAQLLSPQSNPAEPISNPPAAVPSRDELIERIAALEAQVRTLESTVERLAKTMGE